MFHRYGKQLVKLMSNLINHCILSPLISKITLKMLISGNILAFLRIWVFSVAKMLMVSAKTKNRAFTSLVSIITSSV